MNIYLLMSFVLIFAFLNRLRGDGKYGWIGKYTAALFIGGSLLYMSDGNFLPCILGIVTYIFGECFGWGKWIGSIINREPQYHIDQNKIEIFGVTIWDGIHHLANLFINEGVNYLFYSRLALFIRGLYWWVPVFGVFWFFDLCDLEKMMTLSVVIAVFFPLSFEIARKVKIFGFNIWERGEIIYGGLQGLVLYLMAS